MNTRLLALAAFGAATALGFAPLSAANAQMVTPAVVGPVAVAHGDWTLGQREDWLVEQMKGSLANGSLDRAEFNRAQLEMDHLRQEESRMRHDGGGQLTGDQTAELQARLDTMSDKIHLANTSVYKHPW